MSTASPHPKHRAEAESILRATTALARRMEMIHANIRDGRMRLVSGDLEHAGLEGSNLILRLASLQAEIVAALAEADAS